MAKDRVQMPASTAGLTRYFEDYRSKIEFGPWAVVIGSVIVGLLIIALHMMGINLVA